jgi:hypothetical protein
VNCIGRALLKFVAVSQKVPFRLCSFQQGLLTCKLSAYSFKLEGKLIDAGKNFRFSAANLKSPEA